MTFQKKIDKYMENNNMSSLKDLSLHSSIAYTTLREMYTRGIDNSRLSIVKKLASSMGCTIDYLAYDDVIDFNGSLIDLIELENDNNFDETDILYSKYKDFLSSKDKNIVKAIVQETKNEIDKELGED